MKKKWSTMNFFNLFTGEGFTKCGDRVGTLVYFL